MPNPSSPPTEPPAPQPSPAAAHEAWVDLASYRVTDYPHRSVWIRTAWYLVSLLVFEGGWPLPSGAKRAILRWFGAQIGTGVVIKPHVRIKFPWQLVVGHHVWIGQGTWIDNLAQVRLGDHVCISQGVYFCTGSHDYRRRSFDLLTSPIRVESGAWVAARSTLLGGVSVGANALVAAGSVVTKDVPPATIVGGNPATHLRDRQPPTP